MPASDVLLKGQITQECKKALGIKLKVETINANDIQARITSAIQSGTGADIIMALNNWPQLYADSLADVSDVAEEIGKAQGGYYDVCKVVATVGNKWIGVPWCDRRRARRLSQILARRGRLHDKFPENWDDFRDAGKKLKAKGRPYRPDRRPHLRRRAGLVVSVSVVVGRQGGRGRRQDRRAEQQGNGRVGQVRRRRCGRRRWTKAGSPGTTPTTTAPSCRAPSAPPTTAPRSIIEAKKKPDTYQTEKGTPMKDDILHAGIPGGAGGQFNLPGPFTDMLMGYSKNQNAAKNFLRWIHSKPVFEQWFTSQQGYHLRRHQGCGKSTRCGTSTRC